MKNESDEMSDVPVFSERFSQALHYAAELHRMQVRKVSNIPYVSHLLAVAAIVVENGGDEEQAIAALLHDAVEDQGGQVQLDKIREKFGDRVARIVLGCTDTDPAKPGKEKWRVRKERYVTHLESDAEKDILLVSASDKLHNARALLQDLRTVGIDVYDRFAGRRKGTIWYYSELSRIFKEKLGGFVAEELERVVNKIVRKTEELQND